MSYCLNPLCPSPQNPAPQDEAGICQTCGMPLGLSGSPTDGRGKRYVALKPLGSGGFGRTFVAIEQTAAQPIPCVIKPCVIKPCVIKQCFPQVQAAEHREKAIALFRQEAEQLRQLGQHPQIPALFDSVEQDGYLYLIQEFVDGRNLAQELEEEGIFDEAKIRQLLQDLLPVLQFLHEHQVIHRDVKPANIIRPQSSPGQRSPLVLVDLGAAKQAAPFDPVLTGTVIGSAEFTAPEQARGKATFASDLYSLGATCVYLLTHLSPFDLYDTGEGRWVWRDYLQQPISEALGQILDQLLEPATRRRYATANDVLLDLGLPSKPFPHCRAATVALVPPDQAPALPDFTLNPQRAFPESEGSVASVEVSWADQGVRSKPLAWEVRPAQAGQTGAIAPPPQPAPPAQPASSTTGRPPQSLAKGSKREGIGIVVVVLLSLVGLALLSQQHFPQRQAMPPTLASRSQTSALRDDAIQTVVSTVAGNQVVLSPDGERLAWANLPSSRSSAADGVVRVIHLSTGTSEAFPDKNQAWAQWWHPNESLNVTLPVVAEQGGRLWLRNAFAQPEQPIPLAGLSPRNHRLRLSDNHQFLTLQSRSDPSQVSIVRVETGEQVGGFSVPRNQAGKAANPAADYREFALSPDGTSVAIAQYTDLALQQNRPAGPLVTAIEIRDTQTGNLLGTVRTAPTEEIPSNYFFSPSGKTLAVENPSNGTTTSSATLEVWSVERQELLGTVAFSPRSLTKFCFLPHEESLISSSVDAGLQVWQITDTALRLARTLPNVPEWSDFTVSPDGYTLAWTAPSQVNPGHLRINITDLRSGTLIRTLEGLPGEPTKLIFASDGDRLVSISQDSAAGNRTIKLWRIFP